MNCRQWATHLLYVRNDISKIFISISTVNINLSHSTLLKNWFCLELDINKLNFPTKLKCQNYILPYIPRVPLTAHCWTARDRKSMKICTMKLVIHIFEQQQEVQVRNSLMIYYTILLQQPNKSLEICIKLCKFSSRLINGYLGFQANTKKKRLSKFFSSSNILQRYILQVHNIQLFLIRLLWGIGSIIDAHVLILFTDLTKDFSDMLQKHISASDSEISWGFCFCIKHSIVFNTCAYQKLILYACPF